MLCNSGGFRLYGQRPAHLKRDTHVPDSPWITSQRPSTYYSLIQGHRTLQHKPYRPGLSDVTAVNCGIVGEMWKSGSHSWQSRKAESWTVGERNRRTKQAREISAKVATVAYNWHRHSHLNSCPHLISTSRTAEFHLEVSVWLNRRDATVGIRLDHGLDDGKTGVLFPAESRGILFFETPELYEAYRPYSSTRTLGTTHSKAAETWNLPH